MGTINNVLKSLSIDHTFFYQLALVVILYFILRNLLFGKLQEVLDLREDKTTKMESGANEKIQIAEKLAEQYKAKINEARQAAFELITKKKEDITKVEAVKVREHGATIDAQEKVSLGEFEKEIETKKEIIMKEAESLSKDLVNKIVQ